MDRYEEYYEEVSDQVKKVPEVPLAAVPVVAVAPFIVEVSEIPDNPESTPLSAPSPSPEVPSPLASPGGDLQSFMGFYTADDLTIILEFVQCVIVFVSIIELFLGSELSNELKDCVEGRHKCRNWLIVLQSETIGCGLYRCWRKLVSETV